MIGLSIAEIPEHSMGAGASSCFDADTPIPYTGRNRASRVTGYVMVHPEEIGILILGRATDCYHKKESGVDNKHDDLYAARRAALEAQFQALPPAGSDEYWQYIEPPDAGHNLPLEVLGRCFRERDAAGAVQDAERVMNVIWRQVQPAVRQWSWHIASQSRSGMKPQYQEELEQDCFLKLWEELTGDDPAFLLVYFSVAFMRLRQHVAHEYMEKAGDWQRPGVSQPTRVPRGQMVSLEATQTSEKGEQQTALSDQLVDPHAQDEFDQVNVSDLLIEVRNLPENQRTVILDRFWEGLSQEETAAKLGISTRMVRYLLQKALRELGVRYGDGEEGNRV